MSFSGKELNILLLGQTGCGKSTFINALANYFQYKTFDDALQNLERLQIIVPTRYSWLTSDFDEVDVTLGKDKNECCDEVGVSATQWPREFVFKFNDGKSIRLIDTPGFADTAGMEKDKINTERILNILHKFSHIHAVCMLFKCNETRMTHVFKYCFNTLFTQMHKNIFKNIICGFTFTKGSNFEPGSTLTLLRANICQVLESHKEELDMKLGSHNIVCFDNDCFNFLGALSMEKCDMSNKDNYAMSWKKSSEAAKRFIEMIDKLEPYSVNELISLQKVRTDSMKLIKVYKKVQDELDKQCDNMEKKSKNLRDAEQKIRDLIPLTYRILKHTKEGRFIICFNKKCEKRDDLSNYCMCRKDSNAWDSFIKFDMLANTCKHCNCDMRYHADATEITEKERELDRNCNALKTAEFIKRNQGKLDLVQCRISILKLNHEKQILNELMHLISSYISKNSIVSVEDMSEQIKLDIESEKRKHPVNTGRIQRLEDDLEMQNLLKELDSEFQSKADSVDEAPTAEKISEKLSLLRKLPYIGSHLEKLYSEDTLDTYYEPKTIFIETVANQPLVVEQCSERVQEARQSKECSTGGNSARKEINMLLLGQSGCGKSTFINALSNYWKYKSFDDALDQIHDLHIEIPTWYFWTSPDYNQVSVVLGKDSNECFDDVGGSATQEPREITYEYANDCVIRIIDTPGFGDTTGTDKDKKNSERIFEFIKRYEYLHTVCILFKPNETRNTHLFNYCFNMLFTQMDRNILKNIICVFTFTRGEDFKPGQTLPILRNNLRKIQKSCGALKLQLGAHNILCFENDCFNFLGAVKTGNDDISKKDIYALSWEKSSQAAKQLLEMAEKLEPYSVRELVSIQKLRQEHTMLIDVYKELQDELEDKYQELDESFAKFQVAAERVKELSMHIYSIVHYTKVGRFYLCSNDQCIRKDELGNYSVCKNYSNSNFFSIVWDIVSSDEKCTFCFCKRDHHQFPDKVTIKKKEINKTYEMLRAEQIRKKSEEDKKIDIYQREILKLKNEEQSLIACLHQVSIYISKSLIGNRGIVEDLSNQIKLDMEREKNKPSPNMDKITRLKDNLRMQKLRTISHTNIHSIKEINDELLSLENLSFVGPKLKNLRTIKGSFIS